MVVSVKSSSVSSCFFGTLIMDPLSMDTPFCLESDHASLVHLLLEEELKRCDNPHLTYETLILRLVKRLLVRFRIPWAYVMEVVRQGPCMLDEELHRVLQDVWNRRKRPVTLDEQHCVERILGRDHVRAADLIKLIGIIHKIADPPVAWHFFAVDGFLGDDPKRYVDAFRYCAEDVQGKHIRAVRLLYDLLKIENPAAMRALLETIFRQSLSEEETDAHGPREAYLLINGHANTTHALLAVDGLGGGKWTNGPHLDCKRYIENLKYGLSGEQGRFDRDADDDVKRVHAFAVRKVYEELDKHRSDGDKLVNGVYRVMCKVLKDFAGMELPPVEETAWSEQVLEEAANVYKENIGEEVFKRFVKILKAKISSNGGCSGDEGEVKQNKRKREQ
ncbi:hypothetical protein AVEN_261820-1 [Araneus ventricosus]|uniref:Uncharacterized protein n=1 Tax=Araneus ventricosus TaxID=182803 RepID=A0A4Y2M017_ARAVE|nr:hypothetical protein AVEN_261820-1 [Araneus ventricosus]